LIGDSPANTTIGRRARIANSQKQTAVQVQAMSALPQKRTSVGDR
jgi:hypothetical protein